MAEILRAGKAPPPRRPPRSTVLRSEDAHPPAHVSPAGDTDVSEPARSPGDIVDVGCGDGRYALELPERYTPYGIEISRDSAAEADLRFSERGGRCINAPTAHGLDSFGSARFDGGMLNSYLEHEQHPVQALEALRRVLKPGAIAIVKVPNFASLNARVMGRAWCGIRLPDHVNYFTPASLERMALTAGFRSRFPRRANLPTNDNFWAFLEAD